MRFIEVTAYGEKMLLNVEHIAGEFLTVTMPRLAELVPEGGTKDDVRIVFFFDN